MRRTYRYNVLFGLLVFGVITSGLEPSYSTPKAPGTSGTDTITGGKQVRPPYWSDQRLEKVVTVFSPRSIAPAGARQFLPLPRPHDRNTAPRPIRVIAGQVAEASVFCDVIREQTGVTLVLAGIRNRELMALPERGVPARELMDKVAVAFEARWYPGGKDVWVLAASPDEVRLTLLDQDTRWKRIGANVQRLAGSITAAQWNVLLSGGAVGFEQLNRSQQAEVLQATRLCIYDPGDIARPTPAAASGRGLVIEFTGSGKDARLHISEGGVLGGNWSFYTTFWNPQAGNWTFGFPPPR